MTKKLKWYWDYRTGETVYYRGHTILPPTPRTPAQRRTAIVNGLQLWRQGMDESWVVLGEDWWKDYELISPEKQKVLQEQKRRVAIANQYNVPISWLHWDQAKSRWNLIKGDQKQAQKQDQNKGIMSKLGQMVSSLASLLRPKSVIASTRLATIEYTDYSCGGTYE